jgi:hypothetical protein
MWLSLATNGAQWRTNKIQGHTFVGNLFSGKPRTTRNLYLFNYDTPHQFIGNTFLAKPTIHTATNLNTHYGVANTIEGKPNNAVFGVSDPVR